MAIRRILGEFPGAVRDYLAVTMRHPVGFLGVNLTSFAGVTFVILFALQVIGATGNPYLGLVTFLILPALFLAGLLLMPIGHYLDRRRQLRRMEGVKLFPVVDLNLPRNRTRFVLLMVVTLVNVCILAVATFRGIEFMDSVQFCGETCHAIMHPESTAHRNSPHSRVRCVDCHIGPGASWFVKSKLSGTRQVFAAILRTYPKPIPTPVQNLRPARETCEQCHWPTKFVGNKIVVKTHYRDDEANTPLKTVLSLKVGGGMGTGEGTSIHWHVSSKVEYRSDEAREKIYWVRAERKDGTVKEFIRPGFETLPDSVALRPVRRMDCVDCHNRPTHIYKPAGVALDEAMTLGGELTSLPFLHREALAALEVDYPDKPAALTAIAGRLRSFYTSEYPDLSAQRAGEIDQAVQLVQKIYSDNVFPSMKIGWTTYPNHIGHQQSPGCFRCHDEELATREGETITQDCSNCHSLLAVEEENPEILQDLFPED